MTSFVNMRIAYKWLHVEQQSLDSKKPHWVSETKHSRTDTQKHIFCDDFAAPDKIGTHGITAFTFADIGGILTPISMSKNLMCGME